MDSNSWAKRVEEARTADEIVALVRAYLDSRDPDEMRLLPRECALPERIAREEISDFAYRLAAYHGHGDATRLVQRLSSVVSRAAVRMAELERRPDTRLHAARRASTRELAVVHAPRGLESLHACEHYHHLTNAWHDLKALYDAFSAATDEASRRELQAQITPKQREWRDRFDDFSGAFGLVIERRLSDTPRSI